MRIVENTSAYDTRAVRRVLQAVARTFRRREDQLRFWPTLRVRLSTGRSPRVRVTGSQVSVEIRLPPLQGAEFVGLARQQHGGDPGVDHGGLTAERLALQFQGALFSLAGMHRRAWHTRVLLDDRRMLRGIQTLISLRVVKSAPLRDKLHERHARTVELEKVWLRKEKLATTKIRKLRQRRLRYERQLARREESK